MDPPYGLAQRNCIVFSFGINNEWSFDDAMDLKGCKVYAFDPTMGKESHYRTPNIRFFNIGVGGEDVTMNNEWKFTYCGVSSVPATKAGGLDSISVKCKWTIARQIFILPKPSGQRLTSEMRCSSSFMTYKSIVKLTSTENSPIDYFKMDVEGSEVSFFQEALYNSSQLLKKVKQIGLEIHPYRGETLKGMAPKYWELFQKLECLGFRLMHMNLNMVGGNSYTVNGTIYSGFYELVWMMENPVE
ncbi:uncharacterized protein LOC143026946 [Oratosquilla oratoria]|uniref:uncharacterized protein LOC143026946 n=1 Tax=Oratosquilla oratoria TaxID=337810 RepID=UPI003F776069